MRVWVLLLAVLAVLSAMVGVAEAAPAPQQLTFRRTFGFRRVIPRRRNTVRSRPKPTKSRGCTNSGLFVVC